MELVQGFGRRQELEKQAPVGGLADWIVGALQGRVRIKWRCRVSRTMRRMELVETLSLGGRRQLMLVACEGERYLVGCHQDAVSSIVRITPEAVENRSTLKAAAQAWP